MLTYEGAYRGYAGVWHAYIRLCMHLEQLIQLDCNLPLVHLQATPVLQMSLVPVHPPCCCRFHQTLVSLHADVNIADGSLLPLNQGPSWSLMCWVSVYATIV